MAARGSTGQVSAARRWFALQAAAGAGWWIAVFVSDDVRSWTLGGWDPLVVVGPDLLLFVGGSALAALTGRRAVALVVAGWTIGVTAALSLYGLVERVAGWGVVLMSMASLGTVAAAATLWFGRLPTAWFFVGPFSFRVAGERSGRRHLARSLMQLVVFWATFFLLVPAVLAWIEQRLRLDWGAFDRRGWDVAGALGFGAASAFALWSCVTMAVLGHGTPLPAETARDLVVAGPYAVVRNPMAVAGTVQTACVGVAVGSWLVVVVALAGAVIWNELIRPVEEADLSHRFGASYTRYAREVRCWLPTWRRTTAPTRDSLEPG